MKAAINFLTHVFDSSVKDVATILVAEAENDKKTILAYLNTVKSYVEDFINELEDEQ